MKGFRPLPGMKTRVAPLLLEGEPTAMPNSPEAAYVHSRGVWGIEVTGQPKGKRNWVEMLGATLVMISCGEDG
jgi:hypothetical protein